MPVQFGSLCPHTSQPALPAHGATFSFSLGNSKPNGVLYPGSTEIWQPAMAAWRGSAGACVLTAGIGQMGRAAWQSAGGQGSGRVPRCSTEPVTVKAG